MKKRNSLVSQSVRYGIIDENPYCIYCDGLAEVVDHFIPYAFSQCNEKWNLVPSCEVCNQIASDKVFETLDEKRQYILDKRNGRKWKRRLKSKISYCVGCNKSFKPRSKGSTLFYCRECMQDEETEYQIAKKAEAFDKRWRKREKNDI